MKLYAVEERTPSIDGFETFLICSSIKKAEEAMKLYEKNYPDNEYRIKQHLLNDSRLLFEMEV